MIPNTVEVNDKVETQSESVNLIDFSLWESRSQAINDFIRHYSFDTIGFVFIPLLGFFLVISAMLGFGFYLWHLKTSNEHTQNRLLNILNGYLSGYFKPGLYLDMSLNWRHKIAIPVMATSFIFTEQAFNASCDHWDEINKP